MAAGAAVGEGHIQRIIRDLHDAVSELTKEYKENGEPITDDSSNLHKFAYKLEYLLQFGQKEKTTFLGSRKDYWDYFSDCLVKIKGANDGIRFVKSIPELKTSLGKGRAFIRYSLVHQRLADTLQQCLMNHRVTSDWYNSRSPFIKPHLSVDIINYLYELNDVQFDVASRGHDLDSEWPTFASRTLGMTSSPSHMWKPPSRSSSINSLASTYSQVQAHLLKVPVVMNHSKLRNTYTTVLYPVDDELRLELDQSELKQRELLDQVQQFGREASELHGVVVELQRQLDVSLAAQGNHHELQRNLEVLAESERALFHELEVLRGRETIREASYKDLQDMLAAAERKNEELMARLDGVLDEKGQRAASDFNSAQKIHELLNELKEAEKGRIDALAEGEERRRQAEQLAEKIRIKDKALKEAEVKMAAWMEKGDNLQKQLQDLQLSQETMEKQAKVEQKEMQEDKEELEKKVSGLEGQLQTLRTQLKAKESNLLSSIKRVQYLEKESEKLKSDKQNLRETISALENSTKEQAKKIEEYKDSCGKLMEENSKLLQRVNKNEETKKELLENKSSLESELAGLKASEKQLRAQIDDEERDLEMEKTKAERAFIKQTEMIKTLEAQRTAVEKVQLEQSACHAKETQEMASKVTLLEDQLGLSVKEVSRLQEEVLNLRAKLYSAVEEKDKTQAKLEVTEASCAELRTLTEQLKKQAEEQNRLHVKELLQSSERVDAITLQLNQEMSTCKKTTAKLNSAQEELAEFKAQNERLVLENAETRDGLHRVNTEMAELGMTICKLTAEREEAREQWAAEAARIQELQQQGVKETERLNASLAALHQENSSLRDSGLNFTVLWRKRTRPKQSWRSPRLPVPWKRFSFSNRLGYICMHYYELLFSFSLSLSTKEALSEVQKEREELKQKLDQVLTETQNQHLRMSAELEDLGQTRLNLEERLIELIRDKDALWKKSDALEFEQKLRAEEQWWLVDKEATHCLGCQGQFTWWLRRHHCRLCGRIFCYNCSNNFVMTKNSKKERCCRECYMQHNAVVERFTKAELNSLSENQPPPHANAAVTDPGEKPDDGAFDIITEEEVNETYDSDSRTTTGSQEEEGDGRQTGELTISSDVTPDEQEEMVPTIQDTEITLLKSGELTASVPLDIDEILHFGDGSRELFVKSSCYSAIPITVGDRGPIISWVFSSEPKSISFTVVYRETLDTPVEQAKVLIPLTRCNSHKETIQGQLKVRNPGVYTLVFDNSFSRFLSKKVNYHLTIEKPIIYDGSDFP
uniref:FYVE and coiled-coil domain-containing protein 1 n=1 Tax=Sinocyclocheilus rhinocerous TaxID=307959 RepID=A0A673JJK8_9TELE